MKPRRVRRTQQPLIPTSTQPSNTPRAKRGEAKPVSFFKRLMRVLPFVVVAAAVGWGGQVTRVEIEGSAQPGRVKKFVDEALAQPLWPANLAWLSTLNLETTLLDTHPDVFAEVEIKKLWLSRAITVRVVERQPVIRWQTNQGDYGIDPQGMVAAQLGRGEQPVSPLVIDSTNLEVKVGRAVAPARFVDFVLDISKDLKSRTGLGFKRARVVETTNELLVDTDKNYYLRLDSTRPAADQLAALKLLLSKRVEPSQYIDLRLPYKAYYR